MSYLENTAQNEVAARAITIAETFANLSSEAILATDLARLESVAEQAIASPDLIYIRFINHGTILAAAGEQISLSRPFIADQDILGITDGVFDAGVDIKQQGYNFGRVEVGLSIDNVNSAIAQARTHLFGIALFEIVLVALFSLILGTYLTRGLAELRRGAKLMAEGKLRETLPVRGRDELATTIAAFNRMFTELETAKRKTADSLEETAEIAQKIFEQEQKTSTILNAAIDGFLIFNQQGIIEEINPAGAELFQYSCNQIQGKNIRTLIEESFGHKLTSEIADSLYGHDVSFLSEITELKGIRRSGEIFDLKIKVSPLPLIDREIFVAFLHDSTEKKALQAESNRVAAMNKGLVEASLDALVTINVDNEIIEFNPIAEEIFGYPREEVIGRFMPEIVMPHRLREAHITGFDNYLATGKGSVLGNRIETEACRRNGTVFPVELTVQEINIEGEKFFSAFIRDITARKNIEEEYVQAKGKAESASEAKSQFLAHMSHEIRSPLNAILGSLSLLIDGPLNRQQRTFAHTAESSSKNLLSLINDILDFSKIEAGEMNLELDDVELTEIIEDSIDLVAVKALEKNIKVGVAYLPSEPPRVCADVLRVRQIVVNLLDNAIKFTDRGAVTVTVKHTLLEDRLLNVEVTVTDSGIGIPEDARLKLFEEFQQIDNSDRTRFGGTGLGLAISNRLSTLMGGSIEVDSLPGEGSRFTLILPLKISKKHIFTVEKDISSPLYAQNILCVGFHPLFQEALSHQIRQINSHAIQASDFAHVTADELLRADVLLADQDLGSKELREWAFRARQGGVEQLVVVASNGSKNVSDLVGEHLYDYLVLTPLTLNRLLTQVNPEVWANTLNVPNIAEPFREEQALPSSETPHILIVDDSEANLLIASSILERAGYAISTAINGLDAVAKVKRGSYDLILMDLRMPEMDGIEATKLIRKNFGAKTLPIVALTANAFKTDVKRCLDAGMNDFIAKPLEKNELLRMIEDHIARTIAIPIEKGVMMKNEQSSAAVVNAKTFEELCRSLPDETAIKAVELFCSDTPTRVSKMLVAHEKGDLDTLEHEAHTLQGMSASFGAESLYELVREIETKCLNKESECIANLMTELNGISAQTMEECMHQFVTLYPQLKEGAL